MTTLRSIAILAGLLGAPLTVSADATEPVVQPYRHAVSIQVATLDTQALAVQGERDLGWNKLSLAVSLGGRTAAHGDFESMTVGTGVELRRWLLQPVAMTGWYVAARTDLARTSLDDMVEARDIGTLTTWSFGASTGYRFVIRGRVEVTPSIGIVQIVEGGIDGASPTTTRRAPTYGLTMGAVF